MGLNLPAFQGKTIVLSKNQLKAPEPSADSEDMAARLRVMVVDDEESVRDTMRIALNNLGHSAETVSSAEDALSVFDSGRFDVVITDLFLPGMNGDQLARIVKREDGEKPVILLTAYPPREIPPDVDSILLKPFSVESLRETLNKVRS